jgi:intracellular septation protein A
MNTLLIGIIPLLLFALLDSYFNLKIALIAALIITLIEFIYTIYAFGQLDSISLLSIILVLSLVGLSYKNNNRIIFKLKPGILNVSLGLYMVVTYLFGKPLFIELIAKYPTLISQDQYLMFQTLKGQALLTTLSFNMGVALTIHGIIVGYSGIKHNNFWWAIINSIGLIIAIIIGSLSAIY